MDTLTLTHDPLALATTYTIAWTAGTDLAGNPLAVLPDSIMFTTTADTTAPVIVWTSPANGATGVAVGAPLVIAFSEPMASASVAFSPNVGNEVPSWNANGDTLTISHDHYAYSTGYVVTVGAWDNWGNPLSPLPDSFMFTTVDNQGPAIAMVQQPSDTYDGTGPFTVRAVVTDPAKQGIAGATVYYSLNGGAWNSGAGIPSAADTIDFGITGGLSAGTLVSYYIEAVDDVGSSATSPATAPIATHQFRILDPLPPTALTAQGLDMAVQLDWAPPAQVLSYCNYSMFYYPSMFAGFVVSTRFTPMHYPCRIEQAVSSWVPASNQDSVIVHVYADDGTGMPDMSTELITPFRILPVTDPAVTVVDLSGYNVVLASGEFHVAYEQMTAGAGPIFDGDGPNVVRSLYRWSDGLWYGTLGYDWNHSAVVSYSAYTKGLALKSSHLRKGQKPNYLTAGNNDLKAKPVANKQPAVYPKLTGALAMAKYCNGYTVLRSEVTGGPYTAIGLAGNPPTYLDNTAINGTAYYYVVRAEYSTPDTFSANSNEATATPAALPILVVDDDGSWNGFTDVRAEYTAALDAAGQAGNYS
ncbi:hypothetical protein EG831_07925, partial [bacterium]|nr:hypothetical protein [bacterium]